MSMSSSQSFQPFQVEDRATASAVLPVGLCALDSDMHKTLEL